MNTLPFSDWRRSRRFDALRCLVLALFGSVGSLTAASPNVLTLTSPAYKDGDVIPDRFTSMDPHSVTPPLEWTGVPAGTVSFVLILEDRGSAENPKKVAGVHWVVVDLPGNLRGLAEGIPSTEELAGGGVQMKNYKGNFGYGNPGAPKTEPYHQYVFHLYALGQKLGLSHVLSRQEVTEAMAGRVLAEATLLGRYHMHD